MKNQIIFRPIIKKDYLAIEKIIREAWHYDEFCTSKIAKLLSKIFLSSCLSNQTFTLVALLKEQPIGIIMGKNIKTHKIQNLKFFFMISLHKFIIFYC